MKKIFLLIISVITMTLQGYAQVNSETDGSKTQVKTYKLAKTTGKLQINLGQATIEGHAGNEIIFSLETATKKEDDRAKGLRAINSLGLEDNTGLGINVTEKDGVIEVNQLKRTDPPNIKILVPKNVIVSFTHQSVYGEKVLFKNMENEIEVSANYNNIVLENVTGPVTVKSVHGNIDAIFSENVKGPLSIVSVHGHVDVTLPKSVKADLKMSTSYGEILVSPDFKIDIEKKGDMISYGDQANGKVNGGGINITLRSDHNKIYLRTK